MALQPEHVTFNSLATRCAADLYPPGQTPAPYPCRQVDDFRSAVSYLQTQPEVLPERIGLWGVSTVLDRRIKAVVVQSSSVWYGWRYLERLLGREGVHAMGEQLDEGRQRRYETDASLRVPHLSLDRDNARQAHELSSTLYPTYRNAKALDSTEHLLTFAQEISSTSSRRHPCS